MADFDEFLISEFNEQHNNMRQIESSMTQMILGFFSIEGIILAGSLTLLSINKPISLIITILAPIFWFLFLFGHITYNIAIYSFMSILEIDFQNIVARKYFGTKYAKKEYLYFLLNPEVDSGGVSGDWEKVQDNRSAIARFVGTVNTVNVILAVSASIYSLAKFTNPQIDLLKIIVRTNLLILFLWLLCIVGLFVAIQKFYHWLMFLRLVRHNERITLQRRKELLNQISKDSITPKIAPQ